MSAAVRNAACVLAALGGLGFSAGGAPSLARRPPQAGAAPTGSVTARALFRAARAGLVGLPPMLAAREEITVAEDEARAMPGDAAWQRRALADGVAAFQQLDATAFPPPPRPMPPEGWYDAKDWAEANLIVELLTNFPTPLPARLGQTLDLIRAATARKGPLYSAYFESAFVYKQDTRDDPLALAQECQAADGSFPYQGAFAIFVNAGARGGIVSLPAQIQLMRAADAATRQASDPMDVLEALGFLANTAPIAGQRHATADQIYTPPGVFFTASANIITEFQIPPAAYKDAWVDSATALLRQRPSVPPMVLQNLLRELWQVSPGAAAGFGRVPPLPRPNAGFNAAPAAPSRWQQALQSGLPAALAYAEKPGSGRLFYLQLVFDAAVGKNPKVASQAVAALAADVNSLAAQGADQTLGDLQRLGLIGREQSLLTTLAARLQHDAIASEARAERLAAHPARLAQPWLPGAGLHQDYSILARYDFPLAAQSALQLDAPLLKPLALSAVGAAAP